MGLRPTKANEDISGADPLDPLFGLRRFPYQADEGADQGVRPSYVFKGAWDCARTAIYKRFLAVNYFPFPAASDIVA
jgi:hypothetical protein